MELPADFLSLGRGSVSVVKILLGKTLFNFPNVKAGDVLRP